MINTGVIPELADADSWSNIEDLGTSAGHEGESFASGFEFEEFEVFDPRKHAWASIPPVPKPGNMQPKHREMVV